MPVINKIYGITMIKNTFIAKIQFSVISNTYVDICLSKKLCKKLHFLIQKLLLRLFIHDHYISRTRFWILFPCSEFIKKCAQYFFSSHSRKSFRSRPASLTGKPRATIIGINFYQLRPGITYMKVIAHHNRVMPGIKPPCFR